MHNKILIIDDERRIVEILEKFLIYEKFEVSKAYDGREGLDLLKRDAPDLIILDEKMPGMGGANFIKEMKKVRKSIPVIVLTGSINLSQFEQAKKPKYKHLLYKPVRLVELLKVINEVLKRG